MTLEYTVKKLFYKLWTVLLTSSTKLEQLTLEGLTRMYKALPKLKLV